MRYRVLARCPDYNPILYSKKLYCNDYITNNVPFVNDKLLLVIVLSHIWYISGS